MEIASWQKELLALLGQRGLSRTDVYSVMLVLSREEKGREMIERLKRAPDLTVDEICEVAGKIAFGENA
ncbi:MAG: hypothetical protein IKC69_04930 [Clostridia bacterium]|nr:hypothetical protein [Clostridia bacterium]